MRREYLKITPLDIRRQEFSRKVRGFDPDEVETFLEMMADEFEALTKENAELKDRIINLDSQVTSFREMEKTLQDTIVTAQKARDEAKSDAHKEAEFIVREAELKAERWIEEARHEVMALKRELANLKSHKAAFIAKMKGVLNSQNELLNVLGLDPEELRLEESSSSEAEEKNEARGHTSDDPPTLESNSFRTSRSNDHEREMHRSSDSSPTEGFRRPNRRLHGGRNP